MDITTGFGPVVGGSNPSGGIVNILITLLMPEELEENQETEVVVAGSMRKYKEQLDKAIDGFRNSGVKVLAPERSEAINPGEEFILLATNDPKEPWHKIEEEFLKQIRHADFLYVSNINGYVGQSAATEMAYARLEEAPIITAEPIQEFGKEVPVDLRELLKSLVVGQLPIDSITKESIDELKKSLKEHKFPELSDEQRRLLTAMIPTLLRELKTSHREYTKNQGAQK